MMRDESELLDIIEGLVRQECGCLGGVYDSMCISIYAEAMDTLAEYGRFTIEAECGRRVIGRFVERKNKE